MKRVLIAVGLMLAAALTYADDKCAAQISAMGIGHSTFTVPTCAHHMKVEMWGSGGNARIQQGSIASGVGGAGAFGRAIFPVNPGQTYTWWAPLSSGPEGDGGWPAALYVGGWPATPQQAWTNQFMVVGSGGGAGRGIGGATGASGGSGGGNAGAYGQDAFWSLVGSAQIANGGKGSGGVWGNGGLFTGPSCTYGLDGRGGLNGYVNQGPGSWEGTGGRGFYQGGSGASCTNVLQSGGGGGGGADSWAYNSADFITKVLDGNTDWTVPHASDPHYGFPAAASGQPVSGGTGWRGGPARVVITWNQDVYSNESDAIQPLSGQQACGVSMPPWEQTSVTLTSHPCTVPVAMQCRPTIDNPLDRACMYQCQSGPNNGKTYRFRVVC